MRKYRNKMRKHMEQEYKTELGKEIRNHAKDNDTSIENAYEDIFVTTFHAMTGRKLLGTQFSDNTNLDALSDYELGDHLMTHLRLMEQTEQA